jgi:hypothetical protein
MGYGACMRDGIGPDISASEIFGQANQHWRRDI